MMGRPFGGWEVSVYCVQVSARLLNIPQACCCCGMHGVDTRFRAIATRTTGKRVIRTDSRSWDFPLCNRCQLWIGHQRTADAARARYIRIIVFAVFFFVVSLGLLLLTLMGTIGQTGKLLQVTCAVGIA